MGSCKGSMKRKTKILFLEMVKPKAERSERNTPLRAFFKFLCRSGTVLGKRQLSLLKSAGFSSFCYLAFIGRSETTEMNKVS